MKYDVTEYGVRGDGVYNNTEEINALARLVRENGGGTIWFPAGQYVTGSIRLYSNTTLYLESGATLLASASPEDYPKVSAEDAPGYTRDAYCGVITAFGESNIVIEGNGTVDGRGYNWWHKCRSDQMRPRTINPVLCNNVKIKDITILNSPCWTVHPICCENVLVDGITIVNPADSPNTDGINPESCRNVRISNCCVDVGDDCITLKSGTEDDELQKSRPCENILITNCNLVHGHGGIVIGSEMSGGVKNVTVSNCVFQNTDRGIRLKTRRKRGGRVENVIVNNIVMDDVLAAITVNAYYRCGADESGVELASQEEVPVTEATPSISGIMINGMLCRNVKGAGIYMYGLPEKKISNITIQNVDMDVCGTLEGIEPIMAFQSTRTNGDGICLRNAERIRLSNFRITCPGKKLELDKSADVELNGEKLEDKISD